MRAAAINAIYSGYESWGERDVADEYSRAVYGDSFDLFDPRKLRGDELFVLGYLDTMEVLGYPKGLLVFDLKDAEHPYEVRGGRAFVPLRMIAESFRMQVYYHQGLIILSHGIVLDPKLEHDRQLAAAVRDRIIAPN